MAVKVINYYGSIQKKRCHVPSMLLIYIYVNGGFRECLYNKRQLITMEIKGLLHLFFIFLVLSVVHSSEDGLKDSNLAAINRSNFPAGFIFGTASSAYQV
jgi:hypothetical protein